MQKVALPLLLLLVVGISTFRPMVAVMAFEANRDFITESFCINQSRPELKCNGKCFFMQKLREVEKQNQKPSPQVLSSEDFFSGMISLHTFCMEQPISNRILSHQPFSRVVDFAFRIFHPPQA